MKQLYLTTLTFILLFSQTHGQQIFYSKPEGIEPNRIHYDIITKRNNQVIVYKSIVNQGFYATNSIYFYDTSMNVIKQVDLDLPKDIYGVSFLVYNDFFYMFYQYQKLYKVYCMAVKLNMEGVIIKEPVELALTSKIDLQEKNQLYSIVTSENKKCISVFKQYHKEDGNIKISEKLFNEDLNLIKESTFDVSVVERKDFLTEFNVDNDGNFIFLRLTESERIEHIAKTVLLIKKAAEDSVTMINFLTPEIYIDDPKIKIDNTNNKYIITSFYSYNHHENIQGLYSFIWDKFKNEPSAITKTTFTKELLSKVKFHTSDSKAFNDVYIQNIQLKKNGGFIIDAGLFYTFPNNKIYDRWNYLKYFSYSLPSGYDIFDQNEYDHYYPWREWSVSVGEKNTYIGNNVIVFSFDSSAEASWIKVIPVYQYHPFYYYKIGYKTATSNNDIYFLCNKTVKNSTFISLQTINTAGDIKTDILLKNIDVSIEKDLSFLPRYAKQVDKNEIIVPCYRGHHISFARIVY